MYKNKLLLIFRQDIKVPIKGHTYVDYEINTRTNKFMYTPFLIESSKNIIIYFTKQFTYVQKVLIMIFSSLIKVVWNEKSGYFSFVTMRLFTKMTTLVLWSLLG